MCSPLLAVAISLIEDQVDLPADVTKLFGPCGSLCGSLVCGANFVCEAQVAPVLDFVNNQRAFSGCGLLSCPKYDPAPGRANFRDSRAQTLESSATMLAAAGVAAPVALAALAMDI